MRTKIAHRKLRHGKNGMEEELVTVEKTIFRCPLATTLTTFIASVNDNHRGTFANVQDAIDACRVKD